MPWCHMGALGCSTEKQDRKTGVPMICPQGVPQARHSRGMGGSKKWAEKRSVNMRAVPGTCGANGKWAWLTQEKQGEKQETHEMPVPPPSKRMRGKQPPARPSVKVEESTSGGDQQLAAKDAVASRTVTCGDLGLHAREETQRLPQTGTGRRAAGTGPKRRLRTKTPAAVALEYSSEEGSEEEDMKAPAMTQDKRMNKLFSY